MKRMEGPRQPLWKIVVENRRDSEEERIKSVRRKKPGIIWKQNKREFLYLKWDCFTQNLIYSYTLIIQYNYT